MADMLSKDMRSWNMSRIRSKNTQPEITVRSLLHRLGYRFRLHVNTLPGKPDIVLPKYKTVVFVHGCFWHRHSGCKRCTTPSSNKKYWTVKFLRNVSRDKSHRYQLRKAGWRVLVLWECETRNPLKIADKLRKALSRTL